MIHRRLRRPAAKAHLTTIITASEKRALTVCSNLK